MLWLWNVRYIHGFRTSLVSICQLVYSRLWKRIDVVSSKKVKRNLENRFANGIKNGVCTKEKHLIHVSFIFLIELRSLLHESNDKKAATGITNEHFTYKSSVCMCMHTRHTSVWIKWEKFESILRCLHSTYFCMLDEFSFIASVARLFIHIARNSMCLCWCASKGSRMSV